MPNAQFLPQIVLIFGAALGVARLFRTLRAPAIIGFLVTGLLLGPSGFRLIPHDDVAVLAEFGLMLLLFTVGLELSPEPLIRIGRRLLMAGGLQMAATAAVTAGMVQVFRTCPTSQAATIGIAVALSSTAIVLKQLGDLRQTDSPGGSIITGILLLQDVVVILIMLLMPIWMGHHDASWSAALLRGLLSVVALVVVTILARTALPFILKWIVGSGGREFVTLLAVLMACAGAYLASLAGWSWALGACIAGLLLAETDMRHQLFADILPFRDVFNALFFISMGMLVNLPAVAGHLGLLLAAVAGIIVLKTLLAAAAVLAAGWPIRLALQVGMGLCTVSEFAYVVIREADQNHFLPASVVDFLVAMIVGTMLVGAMLVPISDRFAVAVARRIRHGPRKTQHAEDAVRDSVQSESAGHIIVVGYGLNGTNLAKVLLATKLSFRVIELNRSLTAEAKREGIRVIVGDAAQQSILAHAGMANAKALVIAIDDQQATRRIVAQAHAARPDMFILARTRYVAEVDVLYRLGASEVIPEEFETSIEIFARVLKEFRIPDNVIEAQINMVRAGRYGMLRGMPTTTSQRMELLHMLDATATQTFLLPAESPVCGRSMRETDLRARSGVTVIAVVRNGEPMTNPTPDIRLEAGDVLVLVGAHKQLDHAKTLLAPPSEPRP